MHFFFVFFFFLSQKGDEVQEAGTKRDAPGNQAIFFAFRPIFHFSCLNIAIHTVPVVVSYFYRRVVI